MGASWWQQKFVDHCFFDVCEKQFAVTNMIWVELAGRNPIENLMIILIVV